MKYIRTTRNAIFIFPAIFDHADFARKVTDRLEQVKSAGFIALTNSCHKDFDNIGLRCYGRSISLGIDSIPEEDSDLVNKEFYGYAWEYRKGDE